ncbi:hypothetical protein RF55_26345 [Lasius niger]|uniref:Uncharacterized protein n=1 Tax=Lasius niger TaxID=67767 RepID=A0A0J7JTT4_LASNI|nr:hypothetical protein RF55_26345 [Lasius niger]
MHQHVVKPGAEGGRQRVQRAARFGVQPPAHHGLQQPRVGMPVLQRIAQQRDAAFRQLFQQRQLLLRPLEFDHRFVLRSGGLQQLIIYAVLCAQPQTLSLPRLHHQRHLPAGQGG